MLAVFGGKMPHCCAVVPGGATENPTVDKIASFLWRLNEIREFIDTVYIADIIAVAGAYPDYFEIGKGCGNYLSYGAFETDDGGNGAAKLIGAGTVSTDLTAKDFDPENIAEHVAHSWYKGDASKAPAEGETVPEPGKKDAYSWLKSPRYGDQVYEVGPLARMLVNYASGSKPVKELIDSTLATLKAKAPALLSTLGRHAARALECKLVADSMADWVLELKPGEPVCADYTIPDEGRGMGLTEAPRGALGHCIEIKDKKIANYQCVVPTTWNGSPMDANGNPGPIEQALIGTKIKDAENPFEIVRIVRSFDPCLACAVHTVTPAGRELAACRVL